MTAAMPQIQVKALACPNCGAQVQLRGFANTLTAVCGNCTTVLDTSTPIVSILFEFDKRQIRKPLIPLGTRGKFDNTTYEVIGFQVRSVEDEGQTWEWGEYVLFNPLSGFRYLTEYQGHWNLVRPVRAIPVTGQTKLGVTLAGRTYRLFQTATAKTVFVLGEFPWRVKKDEEVNYDDYTCPPYLLSAENTASETTWSEGEYLDGKIVWRALGLPGAPPYPVGIYVNQPSPHGSDSRGALRLCGVLELALLCLLLYFALFSRRETVFTETRQLTTPASGEASYVTPAFELKGRPANVEIQTRTNVENHWAYFGYALINDDTGHAFDIGREVGYYHGRDSDGTWTEGGRNDRVSIAQVPAGHYYLRVEPEAEPNSPPVSYTIVVRRDVPSYAWFAIAALLIPLPAIAIVWRRYRFEYERWQESSYASKLGKLIG